MSFTQKDKENIVKFLNYVAQKAKFNDVTIAEQIECFKLLNYFQIDLLKKIDDSLLEVLSNKPATENLEQKSSFKIKK